MDQNINDSKSHVWNSFFKILFRAYNFFIFVQWTSEFFVNFRFSSRNSQSQQKLAKKVTHFIKQFCSKSLTHFTNFNSPHIENNILPQHSPKPLWLYKFSSQNAFGWCQKKHLRCTIFLCTINAFLKHFESKCLLLYISVRKICVQRQIKVYLMVCGGWVLGRLDNFLNATPYLGLVKCFTIFQFNWNF